MTRVTVVISTYDGNRWADLLRAVASARAQTFVPAQVVVAVDHNDNLLRRVRREIDGVMAVGGLNVRGASATRNAGAAASDGDVLAFLDDDAVADPGWLSTLCEHLTDKAVVGAGGRTIPAWPAQRPNWFPPEFDWVVGGTYRGVGDGVAVVRNVWSSNMVIRRAVFERAGGFRVGFGKINARPRPEDTEFCIRVIDVSPGGCWIYDPAAIVWHRVADDRVRVRYFVRRCFDEGVGKAELAAVCGATRAREIEVEFVRTVLRQGLTDELATAIRRRDEGALTRSAAIVAGLACAITGYAMGRARSLVTHLRAARGRRSSPAASTVEGSVSSSDCVPRPNYRTIADEADEVN